MIRIVPEISNGLSKVSAADAFQIRSVSVDRLVRKLGELPQETIFDVEDALVVVLGITS